MKKIVLIVLVSIFLTSCGKNFKLRVSNGILNESWIYCDSFQMITEKEADIVVDGKTMRIKAQEGIYPESTGIFGW